MKKYFMHVSFEAVSNHLKEYLLKLVFAPSSYIMNSCSIDFLKIRRIVIFVPGAYSRRLYRVDEAKENLDILHILESSI